MGNLLSDHQIQIRVLVLRFFLMAGEGEGEGQGADTQGALNPHKSPDLDNAPENNVPMSRPTEVNKHE